MVVRINGKYITDQNEQALNDAYLRNIRIQNIKRFDKENAPVWKGMQKALYPNTLELFSFPTLEQVSAEEDIESVNNYDIQRGKARVNLLKLTADYILDRLEIEQIVYFNQNYNKVVGDVKTRGKFNKDVFVSHLKTVKDDDVKDAVLDVNVNNVMTRAAIDRNDEEEKIKEQADIYRREIKLKENELNHEGRDYLADFKIRNKSVISASKSEIIVYVKE